MPKIILADLLLAYEAVRLNRLPTSLRMSRKLKRRVAEICAEVDRQNAKSAPRQGAQSSALRQSRKRNRAHSEAGIAPPRNADKHARIGRAASK